MKKARDLCEQSKKMDAEGLLKPAAQGGCREEIMKMAARHGFATKEGEPPFSPEKAASDVDEWAAAYREKKMKMRAPDGSFLGSGGGSSSSSHSRGEAASTTGTGKPWLDDPVGYASGKPDDIPEDVWLEAKRVVRQEIENEIDRRGLRKPGEDGGSSASHSRGAGTEKGSGSNNSPLNVAARPPREKKDEDEASLNEAHQMLMLQDILQHADLLRPENQLRGGSFISDPEEVRLVKNLLKALDLNK